MNDSLSILPILKMVPLFKELNENDHMEIIQNVSLMYYPAGYKIFSEGDSAEALYIIKSGTVKVVRNFDNESEKEVAILGPYKFFGEMALFKNLPRSASVITESDVEVIVLKKEDFYSLIEKCPSIAGVLKEEFFAREALNH